MCRKLVFAVLLSLICIPSVGYAGSAGIVHYDVDIDIEAAHVDLIAFLEWAPGSNDPRRSLVYPGLVYGDSSEQWDRLDRILQTLTGQNLTTHDQWRAWWEGARENFQPARRARQLGPGGLQGGHAG